MVAKIVIQGHGVAVISEYSTALTNVNSECTLNISQSANSDSIKFEFRDDSGKGVDLISDQSGKIKIDAYAASAEDAVEQKALSLATLPTVIELLKSTHFWREIESAYRVGILR